MVFITGIDANGDGIGDTPYEIGPNNIDYTTVKPYDITTAIPKTSMSKPTKMAVVI